MFRKNDIMQDVWLSNCCVIAYVILSHKIWRALVCMNLIDSHRRVDEGVTVGNCKMNRSFQAKLAWFAFCEGIGATCVDRLNRVFSTHLIGFMLRATRQERKSALRRPRQCTACLPDKKAGLILIFTPKFTLWLILGGCVILIYQKMKLQTKN